MEGIPPAGKRARHLEFIKANWETLAAECYRGYKTKGRGMIILNEAEFITKPVGEFCKFSTAYVAEGSPEFQAMGGKWPGAREAGWVESYTPEETVLVRFARTDGGVSSYKIHGFGPGLPLLCHQRTVAKGN